MTSPSTQPLSPDEAPAARWFPSDTATDRLTAVALAAVAGLLYWLTEPARVALDSFVPLANAFLQGRLYIEQPMPWLELVPRPEGGWYSPFPPMPAVIVLPFVAVMGPSFDQGIASALVGGANVGLVLSLLRRLRISIVSAAWLTIAFAVGSVHWWAAGNGAVWTFAQVVGVFFSLLALHLAVVRRRPFVAGLLLGLAAASRLPVGLTLPLFIALYAHLRFPRAQWPEPTHRKAVVLLLAGILIPASIVAAYNVARFGTPFEFGYTLIPGVLEEPWYASGLLALEYIPRHLHLMFMRGFDYVDVFPWFRPNWAGASLILTMPIVLWLAKARSRRTLVAYGWLGIVIAMLPNVTHGASGFAQFGYRFILDVLPVILLLLAWVFRNGISLEARVAIAIGVVVNAYGAWAIASDFIAF